MTVKSLQKGRHDLVELFAHMGGERETLQFPYKWKRTSGFLGFFPYSACASDSFHVINLLYPI